ncbi:MAG: hypothetical protein J6S43_02505 [Lentisphaeria bacterium]|nr:hypothetical protein [Lentisphaeria bacterium]
MDCPECYGKFPNGTVPCAKCEFFDSCRYWQATAGSVNSRTHVVSFEAAESIIPDTPDFDHIPGMEEENIQDIIIDRLGKFFRYLLELDEYTLGIVTQIVAPAGSKAPATVRELGALHDCSRQAMHRKMLRIISRHPELSALFQLLMPKLSAGRRVFLRRRACGNCG